MTLKWVARKLAGMVTGGTGFRVTCSNLGDMPPRSNLNTDIRGGPW